MGLGLSEAVLSLALLVRCNKVWFAGAPQQYERCAADLVSISDFLTQ